MHLIGNPHFELMRHDVTFPLYVEVDEIYNLACPAAPGHYQYNPIKTMKTSVMGAINMLGMAKRCRAKVLQEVKVGMIVVFHDLGEYPAGGYQALVDDPEAFLSATYGKKKIKVNFYDGENFVCTINFKVAGWTEHEGGH